MTPSLARNFAHNLGGTVLPLLVAVLCIPVLIAHFGLPRFGLLTLGWSLVGYFSLFDMGLGRALTQRLSTLLGVESDQDQLAPTFWTGLVLMLALGIVGAAALAAATPSLVRGVLQVPAELQAEAIATFGLLAGALPIVILSTGLRGSVEAHQRFDLVNRIRIPMGIATFAGPLVTLPFTDALPPAVAVVVAARVIGAVAFFVVARRLQPAFRGSPRISRSTIRPLAAFGGWLTVTHVVGPLMGFMDRFFIGALVSLAAVAYYATPWEVVTRLLIVSGALLAVLFPALAALYRRDPAAAATLYRRANRYVLLGLFPIVLCAVLFAEPLLALWLGADFAATSAPIAQVLAIGVFVNSSGTVASTLISSAGRPDLTARVHLAELPLYLFALYFLIERFGALGAAIAWSARVTVDAAVLQWLAARLFGSSVRSTLGAWLSMLGGGFALLIPGLLIDPGPVRWAYAAAVLVGYAVYTWLRLLSADERTYVRAVIDGTFAR